jgi:endonuclease G, mitochondrial
MLLGVAGACIVGLDLFSDPNNVTNAATGSSSHHHRNHAAAASMESLVENSKSDDSRNNDNPFSHNRRRNALQQPQPQQHDDDDVSAFAPVAPFRILRPNRNLEICFDTRTRTPVYVQHRIELNDSDNDNSDNDNDDNGPPRRSGKKHRRLRFTEDQGIEEVYRSRNSYYHRTPYDRGHMASAADFSAKSSAEHYAHTYNLCNVAPQHPAMNRTVWAALERLVRGAARRSSSAADEVQDVGDKKHRSSSTAAAAVTYVTTGPLWLPTGQVGDKIFRYSTYGIGIPPSIVLVPTHYFKVVVVVVVAEDKDGNDNSSSTNQKRNGTTILQCGCFVVPNDETANSQTPLQDYVVAWTDLEAVTGLQFYPNLVSDAFKSRADALARQFIVPKVGDRGNSSSSSNTSRSRLLLLTDGSGSSSNSATAPSKRNKGFLPQRSSSSSSYHELRHLCDNQACLPRKQRT